METSRAVMSVQSFTPPGSHPVLACLDAVESALKDVADVEPAFMTTAQKRAALVAHARVEAQLEELGLRVLATADDVAADDGARDAAAWLDHHNRVDRATARRDQPLAEALEQRWRVVQAAMRAGAVSVEQAHVITRALDKLPDHISAEVRALAEERLVAEAASFGPKELRVMGRRILDVVAPELGEEQERKALGGRGGTQPRPRPGSAGRRRGDGSTRISGDLPDAAWDRLRHLPRALPLTQRAARPGAGQPRRPAAPRHEVRLGVHRPSSSTIDPTAAAASTAATPPP